MNPGAQTHDEPLRSDAERNRSRIIAAARTVFARDGVNASMAKTLGDIDIDIDIDIDSAANALFRAAEVYEALGSRKVPDVRARAEALRGGTGR